MRRSYRQFITLLVLCLGFASNVSGSWPSINIEAGRLFDTILTTFCNRDTNGTIALLEKMERQYPRDFWVLRTNKILGDLYLFKGEPQRALQKLRYAFYYQPTNGFILLKGETPCEIMLQEFIPSGSRADVCLSLSRIFIQEAQFDSSQYYLSLADNELNPYRTCGNGLRSYRSNVAPFWADHFLAMGDTAQAIHKLLDYFMERDGDMKEVTKELKQVLLLKYTQDEIRQELKKGIANSVIQEKLEPINEYFLLLPLFDHSVEIPVSDNSIRRQRKACYKHPSIRSLLN